MKHVFVVETPDGTTLSPFNIDNITHRVEALVTQSVGRDAFAQSVCNQQSAIRAIYGMYSAPCDKSPDELGSAK